MTERVCFLLQVKPELIDAYVARHREVDRPMLEAIRDAGRRNYSLFLRSGGLLVGYYETDDDAASAAALAEDPRTAVWEAEMAPYFVTLAGARADQGAERLEEVFNLSDQLSAARLDGAV